MDGALEKRGRVSCYKIGGRFSPKSRHDLSSRHSRSKRHYPLPVSDSVRADDGRPIIWCLFLCPPVSTCGDQRVCSCVFRPRKRTIFFVDADSIDRLMDHGSHQESICRRRVGCEVDGFVAFPTGGGLKTALINVCNTHPLPRTRGDRELLPEAMARAPRTEKCDERI